MRATTATATIATPLYRYNHDLVTDVGLGTLEVSGFHRTTTSVSCPYEFALDVRKMKPGRPIEARFGLVGGRMVRIVGLLSCSE